MASLNVSVPIFNASALIYRNEVQSITYQGMVSKYAAVGALAVLFWDILDNIPEDYDLLFGQAQSGRKFSLATIVYITSRIAALGHSLTLTIFSTAPIGSCELVNRFANAFSPVSVPATGFLFFIRLRAIYNRDRVVVAGFLVFWLTLAVSGMFIAVGIRGGQDGATEYCKYVSVERFVLFGDVAPLIFDTLVFLAISWRISRIGCIDKKGGIRSMLLGTNLPVFTKSLLQDGQIYYLVTIVAGISSVGLMFGPQGYMRSSPLSGMIHDVYLALVNIMACRVFRRTRAGRLRESQISTSMVIQEPIKFEPASSGATSEATI